MKLYMSRRAPNPRRVAMFLVEKGIAGAIAVEEVDLIAGEHWTEGFRAISPLSQSPALVLDDGRALTESRAICRWLEGRWPEPNLMGRDAEEAAFIEMWDRRMELKLLFPCAMAVRHAHPAFAALEKQIPAYAEAMAAARDQMCAWLDPVLAKQPFIAGERFTIADITALVALDFAKLAKFRTPAETWPNLARWRETVSARPSAAAGM